MNYKMLTLPEKWIVKGIPILFLIGSLFHFLYDFSHGNAVIGSISAVNESVWEHTKMVVMPVTSWYSLYYLIIGRKNNLDKNKWFNCGLVALITSIIIIPVLYYFYTEAFGVEILVVDIVILFLALLFGQLLALHFYKYSQGINSNISIGIFSLIILVYIIFTFYPPHLPLFKDSMTGMYGIH